MAHLAILSAKGGAGSSILATNLGCALTRFGLVALMDVHPGIGVNDLLLNLSPDHNWAELLPLASELEQRHFALARTTHPSGLELYAAPRRVDIEISVAPWDLLVRTLEQRVDWLLLDLGFELRDLMEPDPVLADRILLVTTVDPLALRATKSLYQQLPNNLRSRTGLVINQFTRRHPIKPRQIAEGMGIELLATLPSDVRSVGYQVNFGHPCALDPRSSFGRAVLAFAERLNRPERNRTPQIDNLVLRKGG